MPDTRTVYSQLDSSRVELPGSNGSSPAYEGQSYYEMPAIKPSHYGWPIAAYFFIGGLASAAQFIATVLDMVGGKEDRPAVRAGRYLAFLGALVSPVLLIADLETPKRWYNMLRIFRPTSPMSIGSWTLATFGTFSGLAAVGQAAQDLFGWASGRWLARLASLPAALAGGVVALYTGTLLAATNLPLWAGASPFLSSLFASSATSTATAALTLATPPPSTRRRLNWLALLAGAAELFFAILIDRGWRRRRVAASLEQQQMEPAWRFGVLGVGILTPLIMHGVEALEGRASPRVSTLAALATLAGGFVLRAVLVFGGNASARRPEDYLRFSQSPSVPAASVGRSVR
jgi:formate-dependent nitrite reductase membrane component NrfD